MRIPIALEAKTEDALMRAMLENNLRNGKLYSYMSPVWTGSKWVVWFFDDITEYKKNDKGEQLKFVPNIANPRVN